MKISCPVCGWYCESDKAITVCPRCGFDGVRFDGVISGVAFAPETPVVSQFYTDKRAYPNGTYSDEAVAVAYKSHGKKKKAPHIAVRCSVCKATGKVPPHGEHWDGKGHCYCQNCDAFTAVRR